MRVDVVAELLVIDLTADEVIAVQEGKTIGDRVGVTMPDAKIEVLPLSILKEDPSGRDRYAFDRLEKGLKARLKAHLDTAGDLLVFVPQAKLIDSRIAGGLLPRERVETFGPKNSRNHLLHLLPPKGIALKFGGSLQIINIPSYFSPEE